MSRRVVVVGAGPAGLAAAIEAAERGCDVCLVDEAAMPGGQIYRQSAPGLPEAPWAEPGERARKRRLLDRFAAIGGRIDYRPGTAVYAVFPGGEAHVTQADGTEVLRADAIILATGVREQAIPFPGWTLPGVMFAGGAQAVLKSQGVLPGRRVVVAGCGPLPVVVAAQLVRAGATLGGLALWRPLTRSLANPSALWPGRVIVGEGLRYTWSLVRSRVPRFTGLVPLRAIGIERLEAVVLARLGPDGRVVPGSEREIACDLLAVNYGFASNSELAAMAGAKMRHDGIAGGWIPATDAQGRTSVPKLFAAGDGAGLRGAFIAEAEGTIVGAAAAGEMGSDTAATVAAAKAEMRRNLKFQAAVRASLVVPKHLWRLTTDDTIVCRCENVQCGELRDSFAAGHDTMNAIKRHTRAGMGWCGGRTCLGAVAALCERDTGAMPAEPMTARPLARPVSLRALAAQQTAE
jgi:NADPH-dependent 2,4-dienoyl-CoA reductase/sulfur reductase-like enzyme